MGKITKTPTKSYKIYEMKTSHLATEETKEREELTYILYSKC